MGWRMCAEHCSRTHAAPALVQPRALRRDQQTFRSGMRRQRRLRIGITVLAGTLILVLLGVAAFGALVWSRIDQRHLALPGSAAGTTYLIVGSDSRAFVQSSADRAHLGSSRAAGERADIVLLVRRTNGRTAIVLTYPSAISSS